MNGDIESVCTPLAPHFKLKATISPKSVEDCEYRSHVPYASTVGSLMYSMVWTGLDLSQVVSIFSRCMNDLGRDHWEAVK